MKTFKKYLALALIALAVPFLALGGDGSVRVPRTYSDLSGRADSAPVLATGSTTARTLAARHGEVFNVKDYGARGDGIADDTAGIQDAIDASTGPGDPATAVRFARGKVVIPAGTYVVSKELKVWSTQGFHIEGDGQATFLRATAPTTGTGSMRSVLDFNGTSFSTVENVQIIGDGTENISIAPLYVYGDPAGSAGTSYKCRFKNVVVSQIKFLTGIQVGRTNSGVQCDTHHFETTAKNGARREQGCFVSSWVQSVWLQKGECHNSGSGKVI